MAILTLGLTVRELSLHMQNYKVSVTETSFIIICKNAEVDATNQPHIIKIDGQTEGKEMMKRVKVKKDFLPKLLNTCQCQLCICHLHTLMMMMTDLLERFSKMIQYNSLINKIRCMDS
jgi:DNA polymerase II small subunit/DNA polymerase delta subunit B